ncbi:MAG: DUF4397 domain-containing protein [Caldilineaceae bacterium]
MHPTALYRSAVLRRVLYGILFVVILGLSSWHMLATRTTANAASNETLPGGTIPPGGTLPEPPPANPQAGLVRVIHLAPFATEVSATAVDICDGGAPVAGLTGLVYLEQSGYVTLAPNTYTWTVATPGCTATQLTLPPFTLRAGTILTLLIVGGGNQPLTSVLTVDEAGQASFVYLPFIAVQ